MPNNRITISNGTGRKNSNLSDRRSSNNAQTQGVTGFQDPPELVFER
jgi:hypothetical protein